ncbi:MAG: hypothetical protein HZB51_24070 [Chloroflexi bacterium]|nr:hypothetical protein [Chloroflexota bacterium]
MFGSTILDVVLGLVFIYFMLSLIASQANDLIARMLKWRAKGLEAGVRKMLSDKELANLVWNHPLIAGTEFKAPENIPSGTFVVALIDAIAPPREAGAAPAVQAIQSQINHLPEGHVKKQLTLIVNSANGSMIQARAGIESWFNASMDRVSAEYKKRMQLLTLIVAFVISAILGADSVGLANALWREPVMRSAFAGSAQQSGIVTTAIPAALNTQDVVKQLSQYNLPIGWSNLPQDPIGWIAKLIGLILTTLAVSLGAPFWFDLLRTLSNLRNATAQTRTPAPAPAVAALPASLQPSNSEAGKPTTP